MKKNNKIKLSLNKETISELGMNEVKGGGLSILNLCPTVEWYPHQNSRTCCPIRKDEPIGAGITMQIGC